MQEHQQKIWSVGEVIKWATDYFDKYDVDSPRLTIELLLCEILKCERLHLYLNFERLLTKDELHTLRSMIERRVRQREPLQYILGYTEFYGYRFLVNSAVLIPRPETELLVEEAVKYINSAEGKVQQILDIGTGSGCIAIAIAKQCPQVRVTAIDVSEEALDVALTNAARHSVRNVRFLQRNILEDYAFESQFDLVVSNPPYIASSEYEKLEPELRQHEPANALTDGDDGFLFYRHFARTLRRLAKAGGKFLVEIGFGQSENMRSIFRDYRVDILPDYAKIPRVLAGDI